MLRILTLSTLFPDASRPNFGIFVERQTLGLAAHPDVELKIVAPRGLPPFPLSRLSRYSALAELPEREDWKGVDCHRPRFANLPGTGGRWHGDMLARAVAPLLDELRHDFAFDIIDAEFFFPDGPAATALGRRYGVPVSIKARGADVHHWGHNPATAKQVLRAGRSADGLLAVSQSMADDMAAIGLPPDRIRVHNTGVDHRRFGTVSRSEARARLGLSGPLIVSVGALIARKGHDIVIDAVRHLPDAQLVIAGEGDQRGQLEAQIERLDLQGRVRLLGSVAHDDLPPLLAAADVMALASASEGLANAWVESLASGTPIVITDAGGAREVVCDDTAGRIAARAPEAFAAAIADLLEAPPAADTVRRAAERFTWEANTAALYDHLAGIVGDHR
ncbi:glycosyltransferase [Stakelama marina]|uniref:Glycosyltransferase n=1 Tax=Stakelama marina TaxID=2826939 RepID=A0A8T4IGZ6_9SPHN|nr:glycosyltransferase [Stakelama marina]MBR0553771.1 glycosyltransferase [Stakelama marina]